MKNEALKSDRASEGSRKLSTAHLPYVPLLFAAW
jgi:hypothetical protein